MIHRQNRKERKEYVKKRIAILKDFGIAKPLKEEVTTLYNTEEMSDYDVDRWFRKRIDAKLNEVDSK